VIDLLFAVLIMATATASFSALCVGAYLIAAGVISRILKSD